MSKLEDLRTAAQVVLEHARETYPHFESDRGQADLLSLEIAIRSAAGGETKEEERGEELFLVCASLDPCEHPEAGYWQTAKTWEQALEIVKAFEIPEPDIVEWRTWNAKGHGAIIHKLNTSPDHASVLDEVKKLVEADREIWG